MSPFGIGTPNIEKMKDKSDVNGLIKMLNPKNSKEIRIAAVRALGDIGDARVVEPLLQALNDPETIVRAKAAEVLGVLGDGRAVGPLIQILKDREASIREKAFEALERIGNPAVEPLLNALLDPVSSVQVSWLKALGKMGISAIDILIQRSKDKNFRVRYRAIVALGEINDTRVVDPLIHALKDENDEVRKIAVETISKFPLLADIGGSRAVEPLIQTLLYGHDPDIRWKARIALQKIGKPSVEALIQTLKNNGGKVPATARKAAAVALGKIGDFESINPLIEALSDEDWQVREASADTLIELGWKPKNISDKIFSLILAKRWDELVKIGEPAVEPLLKALKEDPRPDWGNGDRKIEWRDVAETIGKIGEPSVRLLMNSLRKEHGDCPRDDRELQKVVVRALGIVRCKEAVEPLVIALNEDAFTQSEAAAALGNIGEIQAIKPLIRALKNTDYRALRENAAWALGMLGSPEAIEPLTQALKDEYPDVREAAAKALQKISADS